MKLNKFEKAWTRYIETLRKIDENQSHKDRARYSCRVARQNLREVCASLQIDVPHCAR